MAGVDVGGGHGRKKSVNHEIPLIPFIDFLLCLVAFLLITAVWSQMARINADARVPGPPSPDRFETTWKDRILHVEMRGERRFQLLWKEGSTVINAVDVPRKPVTVSKDEYRYPDLEKQVTEEWNTNGSHKASSDHVLDQVVLHTDNTAKFVDVIAVIDAVHGTQRELTFAGETELLPAFNVTFATD